MLMEITGMYLSFHFVAVIDIFIFEGCFLNLLWFVTVNNTYSEDDVDTNLHMSVSWHQNIHLPANKA